MSRRLLLFSPFGEKSSLRNHSDEHEVNINDGKTLVKRASASRVCLYIAIALVVTLEGFPFLFIGKNLGMQCMAKALIDTGLHLRSNQQVNVAYLLPCENTVSKYIQNICEQESPKLREVFLVCMTVGGEVTCDGLTQNKSSKKYYDFFIHLINENDVSSRC